MTALVIGGTGPTGPYIVEGLLKRGYKVTILHRGIHETEFSEPVQHLHGDPYEIETLEKTLGSRTFDIVVSNYGRLRYVAQVMKGRTPRLITIGGAAGYLGIANPTDSPELLPMPISEDYQLLQDPNVDQWRYLVVISEEAVMEAYQEGQYNATIFRYPMIYGPRQLGRPEWCIMKRILDGRKQIIVPDGGLTLETKAYAENAGHAVLLAVDHPKQSAGQIYNVSDEKVLSSGDWIRTICRLMGHEEIELVEMPWRIAKPSRPYVRRTHHRVLDITKIKIELGYRDVVPVQNAVQLTVQWIMEHRPDAKAEQLLGDPFDYNAEDQIIKEFKEASQRILQVPYVRERGLALRQRSGYHHPGRSAEGQS